MPKVKSAPRPVSSNESQSSRSAQQREDSPTTDAVPVVLQQQVLNVFRDAFADALGNDIQPTLQQVKKHLFERDFLAAFGKQEYLDAYAARWSPSRALGYMQVFHDISPYLTLSEQAAEPALDPHSTAEAASPETNARDGVRTMTVADGSSPAPQSSPGRRQPAEESLNDVFARAADRPPEYEGAEGSAPSYEQAPAYPGNTSAPDQAPQNAPGSMHIACLGGGAGAEIVALAGWLRYVLQQPSDQGSDASNSLVDLDSVQIHSIDIANWAAQVETLHRHIVTAPVLSKYASAAAKAANVSLLPADAFTVEFQQQDLLNADQDRVRPVFHAADLVTLMFTLNELYTTSVSKTQRLLFELTVAMRPGALLLVVDSPGSYSSVTINGAEKKYPMQWLLDHTLLEASKNTRILPRGTHWEKLVDDDSRWFRLSRALKYPIELENMRYQIHLYRRLQV